MYLYIPASITNTIVDSNRHIYISCSAYQHKKYINWAAAVVEGRLCHCGKGKGKEIEKDVSLLGSPLVLDHSLEEDINSDDSYHTPLVVSSSQPSSSSLYQDSDKENASSFDIELDTKIALVPIGDAPPENAVAIPVREPTLNISGLERLVAVRGQRAFHSSGHPKSSFHPYLCPIGVRSVEQANVLYLN